MKRLRAAAAIAALAVAPALFTAPAASATTQVAELCVHTGFNYTGFKTCSNGWSNIGIANYHIHSWSNTTSSRWCLVSDKGTWYASPGYEPYADYGPAVFYNAYVC